MLGNYWYTKILVNDFTTERARKKVMALMPRVSFEKRSALHLVREAFSAIYLILATTKRKG